MSKKFNEYEKHAYIYSAWVAIIIPLCLTIYIVSAMQIEYIDKISRIGVYIWTSVPMLFLFSALSFYLREIFRTTSKWLFQFSLFKEDETRMPTTELLLWKNKKISKVENLAIRQKLLEKYDYKMMTEEEENNDEEEARLIIVGAVGIMREATRGDKIVNQSNYRYGFYRNMLGGLVWGVLYCIAILIFSICMKVFVWQSVVFLLLVIAQGFYAFFMMKFAARNYARYLVRSFNAIR